MTSLMPYEHRKWASWSCWISRIHVRCTIIPDWSYIGHAYYTDQDISAEWLLKRASHNCPNTQIAWGYWTITAHVEVITNVDIRFPGSSENIIMLKIGKTKSNHEQWPVHMDIYRDWYKLACSIVWFWSSTGSSGHGQPRTFANSKVLGHWNGMRYNRNIYNTKAIALSRYMPLKSENPKRKWKRDNTNQTQFKIQKKSKCST